MVIKVYDYINRAVDIVVPDDKEIVKICVYICSGDETGSIHLSDGTKIDFDACCCRGENLNGGFYIVKGEDIKRWINFDTSNCDGEISRARFYAFADEEDLPSW